MANAALLRAGNPKDLAATFEAMVQTLRHAEGKYAEARARAENALALSEEAFGPNDPMVATTLDALEKSLERDAKFEDALRLEERALSIRVKLFGDEHPEVARSYTSLGWILLRLDRFDDAAKSCERAVAINEAALGKDDPQLATALDPLGVARLYGGRPAEALTVLSRALMLQEVPHAEHPSVANILVHLASTYLALHQDPRATQTIARAYAMQKGLLAADHPSFVRTLIVSSQIARATGDLVGATDDARRAVAIGDANNGTLPLDLAEALLELGQNELANHHLPAAIDAFERACALATKSRPDALVTASVSPATARRGRGTTRG